MKVKDLLEDCPSQFYTVEPDQAVDHAVKLMSGYQVSALMVMEQETTRGVVTERDLVRCHILFPGKTVDQVKVREIMTESLIVAEPKDSIEDAMGMMITARIRHLPVIKDQLIIGMLGLEDLVKRHVKVLTSELHYLKDYISDLQDAAHD